MTEPAAARCAGCDVAVTTPPMTWSRQVTVRGEQWLCERCTRANIRAIEGRLDEAWW